LAALDYPGEKLEIIVVDDGSTDNTGEVAAAFDVNLIRLPASRGPSACRNAGAGEAKGDILAFLDSDCRAGRGWLKELVPFFAFGEVGAVGGFVEGYFKTSHLDRYEEVFSSLNMGRRILLGRRSGSGFYVPTCNLLVREDVSTWPVVLQKGCMWGKMLIFAGGCGTWATPSSTCPPAVSPTGTGTNCPRCSEGGLPTGLPKQPYTSSTRKKRNSFPFPFSTGFRF